MKKVAVIGMGKSGESSARLLQSKGYEIICFDQKATDHILSDEIFYDVGPFEFAVISPGVPPTNKIASLCHMAGIEIISEIELGFRYLAKERVLVGITGTNGKTTVTQMITHCLNSLGIKAHAVGNIGRPLTDALEEEGVFVIELSSFQLENTFTPSLDVAVLTRITPDHLDRYSSFVQYGEAKAAIATLLKNDGTLVLHRETSKMFPHLEKTYTTSLIGYGDNNENEQACIAALSHFGKTSLQVRKALSTFKTAPHRMEWIREINGVNYYNDSKATNVDSVLFALKCFKGPIHLIAGGKHKGSPYTCWKPFLEEKVEKVYLIGESASTIAKDLHGSVSMHHCEALKSAIELASTEAKPGSIVLLSPGCSSFDQFKNYEDRGIQFKQLVLEL